MVLPYKEFMQSKNKRNLAIAIIHCICASAYFILSTILVIFSVKNANISNLIPLIFFFVTCFLYYLFSSLYRFTNIETFFKKFEKILKISFIYALSILVIKNTTFYSLGWAMFGINTLIVITGIIMSAIWKNMPKQLYSAMYLSIIFFSIIAVFPAYINTSISSIAVIFSTSIILYILSEITELISYNENQSNKYITFSNVLNSIATLFVYIYYLFII